LLSDHAISLFGWNFTITSQVQLVAIIAVAVLATAWIANFFRRRRSVVVHRSGVSDQMLYELSRIADSLDRIANRPVDDMISTANNRMPERGMPVSMFGRERPEV
jgi:hypothetical protein